MRQATGKTNRPQDGYGVSIQQSLDGHSFSLHGLESPAAEGVVEVEAVTPRTMLVPHEVFEPAATEALLAAAGVYYAGRLRQLQEERSQRAIQQLQEQLEQEQGNMLLSQIRSHFFYHTLNALQALIVLKPEAAYKMAGDFARYLRFSLDSVTADGGIGSFREELRAVRAYADINQQQLGDRLHMVYQIPDVDFPIPLLTIQPIVENAILHGIKPKVGGGTVTLTLEELPDHWQVTVTDDGTGFDLETVRSGGSIGLENVRRRMARFPGSRMQITSAPGSGTRITLIYGKQGKNEGDPG